MIATGIRSCSSATRFLPFRGRGIGVGISRLTPAKQVRHVYVHVHDFQVWGTWELACSQLRLVASASAVDARRSPVLIDLEPGERQNGNYYGFAPVF